MSLGLTPPGPLAGSLVGSGVLVLVLLVISSSANACCAEERGPITDCSFSHNQDTFSCDVAELGTYLDTCPDGRSKDLLSVPAPIEKESFNIKPYFTSCLPTLYDMGLKASSCHTPCRHDDEAVHAGLNITFRANDWTSEDLRGIAISLRYDTEIRVQCVEFQFGEMTLTNQALEQHEFYYDGFIGLVPGGKYTVSILTLPTNIAWANSLYKTITIPMETCWVPDVKLHETPFAVNFTLFQDLLYSFTQFRVHLYQNHLTPKTKSVDFNTTELYEMDGKWGTNITFDCIEPSADKFELYIETPECIFCAWNMTEIQVIDVPPTFINCPEQDIVHEIEIRRIMDFTAINSVSWLPPTPIFQSNCVYGHNSSHSPNTSLFRVGRTTTVTYSAWQYASLAQCSFNVHVTTVDTVPPTITYCPDNIITQANPRTKTLEVTWPTPSYEDVSDSAMTIVSPDIPDLQNHYNFPVGTNTTVIYEITDAYNNVANCSFSVYVEETPTASTLVIVLSCSGGLLLILIVAVLFWCRTARIRRTREEPDPVHYDTDIAFSPVNPGSMHGVPFDSLINYESQFSINGIVKTPSGHQIHPKSISVPDLVHGSSGYGSNNTGNNAREFLPSFGHPHGQDKDRLESVKEEENNKLLVWRKVDSNDGSHSSSYYDDSPVSLESTL